MLWGGRWHRLNNQLDQIREQLRQVVATLSMQSSQSADQSMGKGPTVPTWVQVGGVYAALAGLYLTAFSAVAGTKEPLVHYLLAAAGGILVFFFIGAAFTKISPLLRMLTVIVLVFMVVVSVVELINGNTYQAARTSEQLMSSNKQQIRQVILAETGQELQWFKNPGPQPSDLNRYLLAAKNGGSRLQQLQSFITSDLIANHLRYAKEASRALFFNNTSILPDNQTAFVKTSEIWYQPLVSRDTGAPVNPRGYVTNLYTPIQFYILEKVHGHWYIASNPAPVSSS